MKCTKCDKDIRDNEPYNRVNDTCHRCTIIEEEGPVRSKWISVKDRMPEEREDVLFISDGYLVLGSHQSGLWDNDANTWRFDEVTHYQYLPDPPKENSSE